MSSIIFQPLLHDPLGWKPTNTTYADHFQWRKMRANRKDKFVSPYGQKYLRQKNQEKTKPNDETAEKFQHEEKIFSRVASVKKTDDLKRCSTPDLRPATSKSAPAVLEEVQPPKSSAKSRRSSSHRSERQNDSRASQRRSTPVAVANEETEISSPTLERRRSQRDEPVHVHVNPNDDDSRHWLTYPNPKTPQSIIDSKIRLGQIKAPAIVARSKSAMYDSTESKLTNAERCESVKLNNAQKIKSPEPRHFFDFNLPDTPDELRAARQRIDKHRYHPSLDNYPGRPQTCPLRFDSEPSKNSTVTPVHPVETDVPSNNTVVSSNQAPATDETEAKNSNEQQSTSVVVQLINTDGLPTEYANALETANAAEHEYLKELKEHPEHHVESIVYRLPTMSPERKSASLKVNRQASSTTPAAQASLRQQDFTAWVRQASDQDRNTAMKILHDVMNQTVNQEDPSADERSPSACRTRSGIRKLGRVRTQPRISIEQNEKELIQHDFWNIPKPIFNTTDSVTSFHRVQGPKSNVIQV